MEKIQVRTFEFSVEIIKLFQEIRTTSIGKAIGYQFARSGTSIGANVEEADAGYSRRDFCYKMNIALGETRETMYWLRLLQSLNPQLSVRVKPLLNEADQLKRILATIVRKSRTSGQ